jgi:hypothetical protein
VPLKLVASLPDNLRFREKNRKTGGRFGRFGGDFYTGFTLVFRVPPGMAEHFEKHHAKSLTRVQTLTSL